MSRRCRIPLQVVILTAAIVAALLAIAGLAAWASLQQARLAGVQASRIAVSLAEQSITRTLESLDLALGRTAEAVAVQAAMGDLAPGSMPGLVAAVGDLLRFSPHLRQVVVLGPDGSLLFDSLGTAGLVPGARADLEALGIGRTVPAGLGSRLRVGKPVAGRFIEARLPGAPTSSASGSGSASASPHWVIPVWLTPAADGPPPFVVVGAVNPGYLLDGLAAANGLETTATRLVHLNGTVMAEVLASGAIGWGGAMPELAAQFPHREQMAEWVDDPRRGGEHLIAYRLSAVYPLAVVQETDDRDLLAHWLADYREVLAALALVVLVVLAMVAVLAFLLLRQITLRDRVRSLSQAVEQGPTAVVITDPDGVITYVNQTFTATMGYTLNDLRGQTPRVLKSGASPEVIYHDLWQTITAGETWHGEFLNRARDGAVKWMAVSVSGVRGADGAIASYVAVETDVTERKAAEARMADLVARLDASNRELEQFAYVASHDLQEPLRMISGYLSLLRRRYGTALDADAQEFIGFAVDGARRMQAMIHDLLEYSRVSSRGRPLLPVDAGAAVATALANLEVRRAESGAAVSCPAVLPWVCADEAQLVSLFQNLIGNAMKYRDLERPLRIDVGAEAIAGDDGTMLVHFTVRDTGIGIAAEHAERVFAIFQRLHEGEPGNVEGNGIGLAICKKIVERHGGRIWLDSAVGQGTTFHVTLRAAHAPGQAPSRPSGMAADGEAGEASRPSRPVRLRLAKG